MEYYENFTFFSLVIMRMGGFIYLNPILGREQGLPSMFKSSLVFTLSIIIFTSTEAVNIEYIGVIEYGIMLLREFLIGFIIGFIMHLFSLVIVFGGEILDMQMGLSMAKVFDAQSGTQIALTSTFYNALYILLFFSTNTHLYLIHLMMYSYKVLPYNEAVFGLEIVYAMVDLFVLSINLGIKLVFPIISLEFLSVIGIGMIMKTIPSIQIFAISIQMKIMVGFSLILVFYVPMVELVSKLLDLMLRNIEIVFGIL